MQTLLEQIKDLQERLDASNRIANIWENAFNTVADDRGFFDGCNAYGEATCLVVDVRKAAQQAAQAVENQYAREPVIAPLACTYCNDSGAVVGMGTDGLKDCPQCSGR